jgi:hypothetical protein
MVKRVKRTAKQCDGEGVLWEPKAGTKRPLHAFEDIQRD